MLRDDYLRFLASYTDLPLLGMITFNAPSRPPRQVEAVFRAGLEENMRAVGLPLLGHFALRDRSLSEPHER